MITCYQFFFILYDLRYGDVLYFKVLYVQHPHLYVHPNFNYSVTAAITF
jgi:hypothetical protein